MDARRCWLTLVVAVVACGTDETTQRSARGEVASAAPRIQLGPCRATNLPAGTARCGTLTVFENRATQRGRQIALHVMVLSALGPAPEPDPIFLLTGGPGRGAATEAGVADLLAPARERRDVVLVDQRGTGASAPLGCALYGDGSHLQPYLDSLFPAAATRTCRARLEARADLTQYATPVAMDDLDDVRAALGYDRINLFGLSYGSKALLVYLRQHPERVRSAVLMGVVTTNYPSPLPAAAAGDSALRRLVADCDADTVCVGAFPRLLHVFDELRARLDSTPTRLRVTPGDTIRVTRRAVTETIWSLLYERSEAARIPLLIHRLWSRDSVAFRPAAQRAKERRERFSAGALLSIFCSEDAPLYTMADVQRAAAHSVVGAPLAGDVVAGCAAWPKATLPPDYREPVRSDVPVLLLSGANDPITPRSWAEQALRTLSHGVHIVRPLAGHIDADDCALALVAAFVAQPDGSTLDRSCLTQMRRPPFTLLR